MIVVAAPWVGSPQCLAKYPHLHQVRRIRSERQPSSVSPQVDWLCTVEVRSPWASRYTPFWQTCQFNLSWNSFTYRMVDHLYPWSEWYFSEKAEAPCQDLGSIPYLCCRHRFMGRAEGFRIQHTTYNIALKRPRLPSARTWNAFI